MIVDRLCQSGLDTFFGVPGGPVIPIFDAILTNPRARLVESRHETHGTFAAMGFHRASGAAPVIVVTAGPGATNVVTGVVAAHLERIPMVILSGDVAWAATGQKLLQDVGPAGIGIESMLSHVCRCVVRVSHAESAAAQVQLAIQAATDPANPGPALVVVSIDRSGSRGVGTEVVVAPSRRTHTAPSKALLTRIERQLRAAARPLLVLGAGCRNGAEAVTELVDALGVPFMTTPQAKGVVSEEHPLSLRNGGMGASFWARAYTKALPDLALVLGTDLDDVSTAGTPPIGPNGQIIHVDVDPSVFARNHRTPMGVVCDVGTFASALSRVVRAAGPIANGAALAAATKAGPAFDAPAFATDEAVPIAPHRVVADLARAAPPTATFVTDIGEHMLFALHYFTARSKDAFVIHLGLGSMGSGIGSAIGLALADRSRPVVCICGDGGMQMAGMELLIAIHLRLPVVFAVFNDGRYNMVYHGYRMTFGRSAPFDAPIVDFVKWAESLGARGVRIDGPNEIDARLFSNWKDAGPVVLDVRQDAAVRIKGDGRLEAIRQMSLIHVNDAANDPAPAAGNGRSSGVVLAVRPEPQAAGLDGDSWER
ncbi:MAG: thiamine pyrophosphate-binding protein [Polyangiaceae bacterium]